MYQQPNQNIEPHLLFTAIYILNFNYGMHSFQYLYYNILILFPVAKEGVQNDTASIFH